MKKLIALIAIALVGCTDEQVTPSNQVTFRVKTNVTIGILGTGVDTLTSGDYSKTFLFNGDTSGSPDIYLQVFRLYNGVVDSAQCLDNITVGNITADILVGGKVVRSNNMITPIYYYGNGTFYKVTAEYDF